MIKSPIIENILNSSFNTNHIHTIDKNGVMYARFEIFTVSPIFSAIAHAVSPIVSGGEGAIITSGLNLRNQPNNVLKI